jgi:hypothetical protein
MRDFPSTTFLRVRAVRMASFRVVAFVGAGAAGVCRSQVSGWAWATTATHPTTRIPVSF